MELNLNDPSHIHSSSEAVEHEHSKLDGGSAGLSLGNLERYARNSSFSLFREEYFGGIHGLSYRKPCSELGSHNYNIVVIDATDCAGNRLTAHKLLILFFPSLYFDSFILLDRFILIKFRVSPSASYPIPISVIPESIPTHLQVGCKGLG